MYINIIHKNMLPHEMQCNYGWFMVTFTLTITILVLKSLKK